MPRWVLPKPNFVQMPPLLRMLFGWFGRSCPTMSYARDASNSIVQLPQEKTLFSKVLVWWDHSSKAWWQTDLFTLSSLFRRIWPYQTVWKCCNWWCDTQVWTSDLRKNLRRSAGCSTVLQNLFDWSEGFSQLFHQIKYHLWWVHARVLSERPLKSLWTVLLVLWF